MTDEPIKDQDSHDSLAQRGIYLLPNLLTTAALFAGFYAIVAAMKGYFEIASIAIFIAMLADGLDGRVARLMNAQSPFGAQYDSLSDMAAFGIAPALVVYSWSLVNLGKLGWLAAFLYAAATALRLARFNIQVADKQYFHGLPSPAAAGLIASSVWVASSYNWLGSEHTGVFALLTVTLAALMVSSVLYYSFKNVDFKGRVSFVTIVTMVFLVTAVAFQPAEALLCIFAIFACSGPVMTAGKWLRRKK